MSVSWAGRREKKRMAGTKGIPVSDLFLFLHCTHFITVQTLVTIAPHGRGIMLSPSSSFLDGDNGITLDRLRWPQSILWHFSDIATKRSICLTNKSLGECYFIFFRKLKRKKKLINKLMGFHLNCPFTSKKPWIFFKPISLFCCLWVLIYCIKIKDYFKKKCFLVKPSRVK